MTVFAHSGEMHWYETIIYLIPIIGFALWLGPTYVKDRRQQRREREAAGGDPHNGGAPVDGAMNRAERRAADRDARKREKENRS